MGNRRALRCNHTDINQIEQEAKKLHTTLLGNGDANRELIASNVEEQQAPIDIPEKVNGDDSHSSHLFQPFHKPHLLNRASSEKGSLQIPPSAKSAKDPKSGQSSSPGRRNSWMSTLSSKFSSNSNPQSATLQSSRTPIIPKNQNVLPTETNASGALGVSGSKETRTSDSGTAPQPPSPKPAQTSFIQSALRRLSSSGAGNLGKMVGTGVVCERKTLNIDRFRERCRVPGLEPVNLRKVAFCVDVEIAPPATYAEEEVGEGELPHSVSRSLIHSQPENQTETRKEKDKKLGKGEGAALKHPNSYAEENDKAGTPQVTEKDIESKRGKDPGSLVNGKSKNPTQKKEKKKRSEDERKERKEQKRKEALANGSVPAELQRDGSTSSATELSPETVSPKSQDRPTTDPLRIYRRCCQLRETPILRRITEQIGAPSACPVATPGIISVLDLSNYHLQLADIITLSDYVAVVPVKRLILEGCGLTDEAVRVILAGLLATKTPQQAKHNKRLGKMPDKDSEAEKEQLGVIEKLSLKNNPKIGREGWRHIAFFINMSRSIKAIDLSMIPFPPTANITSLANKSPNGTAKAPVDLPDLLQQALAGRGETNLEELVMAECGLSCDSIQRIIAGVMHCGITRLGLANNAMDLAGLQHVLQYVQTGKCEGLDLGGNDLRDSLHLMAAALNQTNALYALSLADCNLSTSSLEQLFPTLVQLPNFRFIDLSHNHDLFNMTPNAIELLRRFIPQFPIIKRIHLLDVDLSPESAIELAEILPESGSLAHLNILENKPLSRLASARNEADQEEACAFYASLMVATRVSSSIICIDVDVPDESSSEVVKALAKQIVAYSLRNLDRTPLTDPALKKGTAVVADQVEEKEVIVPDILMHLVGHVDGVSANHDNDEPAPDDDYIVGGTGVVKALDICLSRATDVQKFFPNNVTPGDGGAITPRHALRGDCGGRGKAKEMSKELLSSARKIRARLLPAMVKEAKCGDTMSYSKFSPYADNLSLLNEK